MNGQRQAVKLEEDRRPDILCRSLETCRRAKQRYSKTHVGATQGKLSIESQRKEPRELRSGRDNAKQNRNNNDRTVGHRANNALARTERSQSQPTEFRRRPPERRRGHVNPHGRPRQRWLRELKTFLLSESLDNHRDGGWDTDIPSSLYAHGSPVTTPHHSPPMQWTPSPSFEKEEVAGILGY